MPVGKRKIAGVARIVFAGYLVRFPLGGYAWQTAHYLLGLRSLGHQVWFYEDTGQWECDWAFNPRERATSHDYSYGIRAVAEFLDRLGFGDRWAFLDLENGSRYGPAADDAAHLVRDADLVISFGAVNRLPAEARARGPSIFVDADPVYTQVKIANGDEALRRLVEAHTHLFTFGENIGTERSPAPTGGLLWRPTRQPITVESWRGCTLPADAYTTIGTWDARGRDLIYEGKLYQWRKRTEWLKCIELPLLTGRPFELAMDVGDDREALLARNWRLTDPLDVSTDFWEYRRYICSSRGEFSAAKGMNLDFHSGWFSDRAACYLAAARPVVEQNTGFGDVLPVGPGLRPYATLEDAVEAIRAIESDYERACKHASEVAEEFFAAERVLGPMMSAVGL